MKNVIIPETAAAYQADFLARAFPDPTIPENDFYRRLIGWVMDCRTPLIYEQAHPDEFANLSINFNWLLKRDYSKTKLGPPKTIESLYSLHETTHMSGWLPTRLNELSAEEYANQFDISEVRASNESEILAHFRIPGLRDRVFPGMRISYDLLRERGLTQEDLPMFALCNLRRAVIFSNLLDGYFGPEDQDMMKRLKHYHRNHTWARDRFSVIFPHFVDARFPQGDGLIDRFYEETIESYEPHLSQEQYEQNVIRNVMFGFAMCGLSVPKIDSFEQAIELAKQLEGKDAIIQTAA
jgi:hypothetical protein